MTRGQIIVILDNNIIWTSTEFNGDMYPEGHGNDVIEMLREVEDLESYQKMVFDFNKANHNYDDESLTYEKTDLSWVETEEDKEYAFTFDELLDMSNKYFKKWCSDYLYIKNLSSEVVNVIDEFGNVYDLHTNSIGVMNFDNVDDDEDLLLNDLVINEEKTKESKEKLLEEAFEDCGWNYDAESDGVYLSYSTSSTGEDFGFSATGKTIEEIIDDIQDYYDNFDPDEHVAENIKAWGIERIPGTIRDMCDDADEIEEKLEKLLDDLKKKFK